MINLYKIFPFLASNSEAGSGASVNVYDVIVHHLCDHVINTGLIGWINTHWLSNKLFGVIDMRITRWVLMLWLVAVLCLLIFIPVARNIKKNPYGSSSRWVNMWEMLISWINDEIVEPNFGKYSKKAMPYFTTVFVFVLLCNVAGLIPGLSTATGNLAVTAGLAILTFIGIIVVGFAKHGPKWIVTGFVPAGVPWPIGILLWLIELTGPVTKTFSLIIRLFANMIAGHLVILMFFLLIILLQNPFIGFGSVPLALMMYLLEILVAFIQAYIFTTLSAMYIGTSVQSH